MIYDKPRWWNIIALPTLGILAATGSRKALVFVVTGIVYYSYSKAFVVKILLIPLAKLVAYLSILIIAFIGILQLPIFSEVLERKSSMVDAFTGTGGDSSAIVRMALVDIGWDLFHQSPIIGVGINNPAVYTYSYFRSRKLLPSQ